MADQNFSQPVRTEANGDIVAQLVDGTVLTQKLSIDAAGSIQVKLYDAAGTGLTSTLVSTKQALDVNMVNSISVGVPDTSTFTYATTTDQVVGAVFQDTGATIASGKSGALRMTALRAVHSNLRDSAGNELLGSKVSASSIPVVIASDQGAIPVSGTVTANQGTAGTAAQGWFTKLTDGTSVVAVKAASTAAIATDPSLVVALSPNSPLPTGSNVIGAVTQSGGPWTQNLTQVGGAAISLGQKTMAASLPVVLSSDQTAIPVTQSTSPWVTSDLADGAGLSPGTAGTKSILIGGTFSTALPTVTNGQQVAIQLDSSGRVLVGSIASALPAGTNILGKVGIDQTTPGTTNRVAANIDQVSGASQSATNPLFTRLTDGTTAISESNPLPVELAIAGTPVNDPKDATAIAGAATDNHDYTVTALKSLHLTQIESSSSGKAKMEIFIETGVATGVFVSKWVKFNSVSSPSMSVVLSAPITVAAGVRVRVAMSNLDKQAQDLYSTVSGHEE